MALCFWLPYRRAIRDRPQLGAHLLWVLERLCGLNYVVEGRERIPAGNHIVMSNHTSAWETVAQFLIFPPQVWVLKRELLWIPFVGWGLKLLRPIAINRGEGHRAVNQVIEQGKERLADGLWVIIFPEGTRVVAGETRKFGVSGALLAIAGQVRRAAVAQCRQSGFWPRRGFLKSAGHDRVVIGEPIESRLPARIRAAQRGSASRAWTGCGRPRPLRHAAPEIRCRRPGRRRQPVTRRAHRPAPARSPCRPQTPHDPAGATRE
jgi:1-acyl-sn-glycerol-3-phosphate acyltransferase